MASVYDQYQSAPPVGLSLTYPGGTNAMSWVAPFAAGAASLWGQERANRQTMMMAREQMAFQERMSSTAIRRATQDMRMAGINPMLAAHGGASTPAGATATMQDVVGPAVSSVQHARQLAQELKLMMSQQRATDADADLKDQNRRESEAREKLTNAETKLRDAALPEAEASARIYSGRAGTAAAIVNTLFGGRVLQPLGLRR